jgi:hypothetical protein
MWPWFCFISIISKKRKKEKGPLESDPIVRICGSKPKIRNKLTVSLLQLQHETRRGAEIWMLIPRTPNIKSEFAASHKEAR